MRVFVGWSDSTRRPGRVVVLASLIIVVVLVITLPHAHITANANTAALVGNAFAERGALHKSRELLRAEDLEWVRLDLHSPVETRRQVRLRHTEIRILVLLSLLEETEVQAIISLVANGQVWEDEISSADGTVQVGHARGWNSCQDWGGLACGGLDTSVSDRTRVLQAGEEEEIGIVVECDVLASLNSLSLDDSKFDNRRRVDRSAIAVGLGSCTASTGALRLLEN